MLMSRRCLLSLTMCMAASGGAHGQGTPSYPVKTVRRMLGPAPGSVADGLTRVVASALTELWRQQVLVENRPGAGNAIAPAIVA